MYELYKDEMLVGKSRLGDKSAFEELVKRHWSATIKMQSKNTLE